MKNIMINYINLFGVGFQISPEHSLKKRKVYDLELKAVLPWKILKIKLKIAIISKDDGYRAVFRGLEKTQITVLKEITETFMYELGSVYGAII